MTSDSVRRVNCLRLRAPDCDQVVAFLTGGGREPKRIKESAIWNDRWQANVY